MGKMKLDEKDIEILKELERDGRKSLKSISKNLKLSMTSVFERIKKLERNGVIKGYKAVIDKGKLEKSSTAFALVKLDPSSGGKVKEIAKKVSGISGVSEVFIVNGQWDMVVKLRARDMDEIAKIVLDKLRTVEGIGNVETVHSWETIKESFDVF